LCCPVVAEEEENSDIEEDELDLLKENLDIDDLSKIGISKVRKALERGQMTDRASMFACFCRKKGVE
jgi:hypothetical protein